MPNGRGGFSQPGQREYITSGKEQDLWVPVFQTLALIVTGLWVLFWSVALAVGVGPYIIYGISLAWMCHRVSRWYGVVHWSRIVSLLAVHVGVPFALDLAWIAYRPPWSAWWTLVWIGFCTACGIAPGVALSITLYVRLFDPNWPPPRDAVNYSAPIYPWTRNVGEDAEPLEIEAPQWTIRAEHVSEDGTQERYGIMDVDDPTAWHRYAKALRRKGHKARLSIRPAMRCGISRPEIEQAQTVWIDRGFAQRTSDAENAPVELTAKGRAVVRGMATTPPPQT